MEVGKDIGSELDFLVTYKINSWSTVQGGYCHYFDTKNTLIAKSISTTADIRSPQWAYVMFRITSYNVCYTKLLRYTVVVQVVVIGPHGITSTTYAGHQVVRIVTASLFFKLPFDFFADHRLEKSNHIRIWMSPYSRTYNVKRIRIGSYNFV